MGEKTVKRKHQENKSHLSKTENALYLIPSSASYRGKMLKEGRATEGEFKSEQKNLESFCYILHVGEGGLRKKWQLSLKRKASVLPSYSAKVALFCFCDYVFNLKISKYWKHAKILNVLNTFSEKKGGWGGLDIEVPPQQNQLLKLYMTLKEKKRKAQTKERIKKHLNLLRGLNICASMQTPCNTSH